MIETRLRGPLAAAMLVVLCGTTALAAQTAPNGTTAPAGTAPAMDGAKGAANGGAAGPAASGPATDGGTKASAPVEAHIARLHKLLGITPAEEPQWNEFAAVLRSTGQERDAAVESNKAAIPNQTAPQIMEGYADLMAKQGQDLQTVSAAFDKLYAGLPPEQQKAADATFQKNGVRRAERDARGR